MMPCVIYPDGARPTGWARNAPAMGRADAGRAALRPGDKLDRGE
jgi:hypothetical protein